MFELEIDNGFDEKKSQVDMNRKFSTLSDYDEFLDREKSCFVLNMKFYKTNYLTHYVRATLLNYELRG